jgi:hypothetical protein
VESEEGTLRCGCGGVRRGSCARGGTNEGACMSKGAVVSRGVREEVYIRLKVSTCREEWMGLGWCEMYNPGSKNNENLSQVVRRADPMLG